MSAIRASSIPRDGDHVEVVIELVTAPFRAIILGLTTNDDGAALDAANARSIAAQLIVMADRLDELGGADTSIFNDSSTEKPS